MKPQMNADERRLLSRMTGKLAWVSRAPFAVSRTEPNPQSICVHLRSSAVPNAFCWIPDQARNDELVTAKSNA
jgi:hypothetical protein